MITGELVPPLKARGSRVVGGTLNTNGVLSVKATKIGRETVLAQIIQLVEDAQGSKPPVQRIADTAVVYFIPAVLAIAITAFILWFFVTPFDPAVRAHCTDLGPRSCLSLCIGTCNPHCRDRGCRQGS